MRTSRETEGHWGGYTKLKHYKSNPSYSTKSKTMTQNIKLDKTQGLNFKMQVRHPGNNSGPCKQFNHRLQVIVGITSWFEFNTPVHLSVKYYVICCDTLCFQRAVTKSHHVTNKEREWSPKTTKLITILQFHNSQSTIMSPGAPVLGQHDGVVVRIVASKPSMCFGLKLAFMGNEWV